jgi:hypothetical protein
LNQNRNPKAKEGRASIAPREKEKEQKKQKKQK